MRFRNISKCVVWSINALLETAILFTT